MKRSAKIHYLLSAQILRKVSRRCGYLSNDWAQGHPITLNFAHAISLKFNSEMFFESINEYDNALL
jgi:hypothetical protein